MIPYGSIFTAGGFGTPPECALIVDSGFSFTHVVPMVNHQIQWHAVKRSVRVKKFPFGRS
jgi:actin-related protein 6